jgi:hypothetical protein
MLNTIIPKSDQLNADDLLGGRTLTITITKVGIKMDEQPVSLNYEGDKGKPYKPGKSMRRVLVNCWGPDANVYVGRKLRLYCDPAVKFGGMEVGGIRISHMSHINSRVTMALTATKAQRRPFTVDPLVEDDANPFAGLQEKAAEQAALGVEAYKAFWGTLAKAARDHLLPQHEALKAVAAQADAKPPADEPKPDELMEASIASMIERVDEAHTEADLVRMKELKNDGWRKEYELLTPDGQQRVTARIDARLAKMRAGG